MGTRRREEPRQEAEGTFLPGQLEAFNLTAAGEAANGRACGPCSKVLPGSQLAARLRLRQAPPPSGSASARLRLLLATGLRRRVTWLQPCGANALQPPKGLAERSTSVRDQTSSVSAEPASVLNTDVQSLICICKIPKDWKTANIFIAPSTTKSDLPLTDVRLHYSSCLTLGP